MNNLIDREQAIAALGTITMYKGMIPFNTAMERIKRMPSAELSTNLAEVGTDCISRQAAIDALCDEYCGGWQDCKHYPKCENLKAIQNLPPAQPKRGKWIRTGSGSLYDHYECSECGKAPKWECMGDNRWKIAFTDFCPNCGADMRGKQDG